MPFVRLGQASAVLPMEVLINIKWSKIAVVLAHGNILCSRQRTVDLRQVDQTTDGHLKYWCCGTCSNALKHVLERRPEAQANPNLTRTTRGCQSVSVTHALSAGHLWSTLRVNHLPLSCYEVFRDSLLPQDQSGHIPEVHKYHLSTSNIILTHPCQTVVAYARLCYVPSKVLPLNDFCPLICKL